MSFGSQSVTFVSVEAGGVDRLGIPTPVLTSTVVEGCLFQPVSVAETVTDTDTYVQVFTCVAPPQPVVLATTAVDELIYDGVIYQVTGVRHFCDFLGNVDHVTVTCERRIG